MNTNPVDHNGNPATASTRLSMPQMCVEADPASPSTAMLWTSVRCSHCKALRARQRATAEAVAATFPPRNPTPPPRQVGTLAGPGKAPRRGAPTREDAPRTLPAPGSACSCRSSMRKANRALSAASARVATLCSVLVPTSSPGHLSPLPRSLLGGHGRPGARREEVRHVSRQVWRRGARSGASQPFSSQR